MIEILITGTVSPAILLLVQWLVASRKERIDVKQVETNLKAVELDSVQQAITIWREAAEQQAAKVKEKDDIIFELKERVNSLYEQNLIVIQQLEQMKLDHAKQLTQMKADHDKLLEMYNALINNQKNQ